MLVRLPPLSSPPAPDQQVDTEPQSPATEQVSEQAVTLATEEERTTADEDQEPEAERESADREEQAKDGGGKNEETPQKLTRNQRRNRKLAEQAAKIKDLEVELARIQGGVGDELSPPRPQDFETPLAYARAFHAFEIRRLLRDDAHDAKAEEATAAAGRERTAAYQQRLTEIIDRLPDFDAAVRAARHVDIRDDIIELIQESAKGPLIVYHLAKNPEKVLELNRLSQRAAAREIGRLEARIRGPQPKRHTLAPPPITPPTGGTGGVTRKVEHMSMDEFVRERDAGRL